MSRRTAWPVAPGLLLFPAAALGALAVGPPPALVAQDRAPGPTGTPPVAGIVEVPALFAPMGLEGRAGRPGGPPPLVLRTAPSAGSPVAVTVESGEGVASAEHGYEEAGALVYGRDRGWSLLVTGDGVRGWMDPADAGTFHPLEELLPDRLTYLTDAWEGTLGPEPGLPTGVPVRRDPRRRIVGYVEPETGRRRVVLGPDDDPEAVRRRYRASASSLRTRPDGTRIMEVEVGSTHPVFERPDSTAPVVAEVETNRSGHILAVAGGTPTRVPVFATEPGWLQVALRSWDWRDARRGWVEAGPAWSFTAVDDDEAAERLVARVWGPAPTSVRVRGFETVGDRLWVEVELLGDTPCAGPGEPTVVARGWVPAHAATGAPTVWFHSRGC